METIKKYNTSDFKLKDKVIINLGEAGKGIKSFWVDGIISDIHPNRITVQRNNPFGNKPLEEQIPNKLLTSEYIVKEEDAEKYANGGEVNEFDYMLLGRLKADADFYLGYGNRNERRLWALNVDDHIKEMKDRWNALPEDKKPEWLTMEDILEYERKMKNPPKSKFDYYKVPNEQLYAIIECNPEYKDNFGTECIVIRNKKTEEAAIAEVERLNKLGYSDYAKGGQLPEQKNIDILQKGLENPLIPQNVKTKIEAKIKELQTEIDKKQQEAKKAAEKPTLKDLEDRLKIVKKMAAKKPELKARVKIIEKMIAKEKKENAVEKLFSVNPSAIGKAKYSINFYDGGKHKDSSEHIGIDTFKSKKDLTSAIEKYKKQGYKQVERAEVTTLQGNEYTVYPKDLVDRFKNGGSIPVNVALQKTADQPYEIIKTDIPKTEAQKFIEEYKQSGKPYHDIMIDDLPFEDGGETWIQDSVEKMKKKGTVGSFTNKAARHGLTPIEYAKKVLANPDKHTEKTRRQAQFVKNTNPELFEDGGEVKSIRFTSNDYNKLVGDVSEDYPYYSVKNGSKQEIFEEKTEQKVATWDMQKEELKINQKASKQLKDDLINWLKRNSYITN